ncbi:hypothetical protein DLAC_03713 [Tieghemostelium lacteum]|uniref:Uncharacterized protein n=1 Tax=Tieghemostelium lacteum TaxID=361077 RepID=A0A152A0N6_TIELA|nr:hypothetical protein DLAC_03713 [Tieghemostelium lacteum]|eukprot:KYQ99768.1 hypothetical protein DLAC_03713 [Tieghemostelium lacteum]
MYKTSIILVIFCYISLCSAVDWYNFRPYNSTTCTGTMYGVGYSIKGDNIPCTSNIEGTFHSTTSIITPSNTTIKLQYYSNSQPKLCSSPSLNTVYNLNQCQDAGIQGFNAGINSLWYSKNFYVNKTSTPYYPTSGGAETNILYTMYNLACTTITGYAYHVGYTTLNDPNDPNIYYRYYCEGGVPYREYCEQAWGCDGYPQDISQSCYPNYSFFLARTVTCV